MKVATQAGYETSGEEGIRPSSQAHPSRTVLEELPQPVPGLPLVDDVSRHRVEPVARLSP